MTGLRSCREGQAPPSHGGPSAVQPLASAPRPSPGSRGPRAVVTPPRWAQEQACSKPGHARALLGGDLPRSASRDPKVTDPARLSSRCLAPGTAGVGLARAILGRLPFAARLSGFSGAFWAQRGGPDSACAPDGGITCRLQGPRACCPPPPPPPAWWTANSGKGAGPPGASLPG